MLVEVAGLEPTPDPLRVDLDAQRHATVHRHGQGLGAAHAAEPGGEGDRAGERAAEAPAGDLGEALVGPLDDPLAADVDPGACGHLPVHGQPERFELAELLPAGPVRDQVGVGDQDARRPLVGSEDPHWHPRLDQHRLVVAERAQRGDDRVEGLPGSRRPSGAPVDDEVVGPLSHFGIEVVHQHPHRGLLQPAATGEIGSAGRVDLARPLHLSSPTATSTPATSSPEATRRSAVASSGASERSGPGPGTPADRSAASAAPVPDPGWSGDRSSSPRAAHVSSTARIRSRLATEARSLRAAPQPIEMWSSCIALVGRESTLAGAARRRFSATIAAWVYWAIISPESTPGSPARNGGKP